MVIGSETKNDGAGEGQQQITALETLLEFSPEMSCRSDLHAQHSCSVETVETDL
jgi:hypothetical protein